MAPKSFREWNNSSSANGSFVSLLIVSQLTIRLNMDYEWTSFDSEKLEIQRQKIATKGFTVIIKRSDIGYVFGCLHFPWNVHQVLIEQLIEISSVLYQKHVKYLFIGSEMFVNLFDENSFLIEQFWVQTSRIFLCNSNHQFPSLATSHPAIILVEKPCRSSYVTGKYFISAFTLTHVKRIKSETRG